MVRDRCMSLLASFTYAELERGIAEINERHPGDYLDFRDRFAFIRRDSALARGVPPGSAAAVLAADRQCQQRTLLRPSVDSRRSRRG
jgi:hypothetical protein